MEPMMSESEEAQQSLHAFFSPRSITVVDTSRSEGKLEYKAVIIIAARFHETGHEGLMVARKYDP